MVARKILVVDDEAIFRLYSKQFLEEAGYLVRVATSGQEAIGIAASFYPDVLLADWMLLNTLDGLSISVMLRKSHPDLVTILITGFPLVTLRERATNAGVFRCLSKPVEPEEMLSAVRDALGALDRSE